MRNKLALSLLSAVIALLAVFCSSASAQAPNPGGPDYPRLAMWYPGSPYNTMEQRAAYDLAIGDFSASLERYGKLGPALKSVNPGMTQLTYFNITIVRHSSIWEGTKKANPYIAKWPARWFLTEAGTTVDGTILPNQTTFKVAALQQTGPVKGRRPAKWDIFRPDFDVQVGNEIMTVTSVDAAQKSITVERGMNGTKAVAHDSGSRIAPLARFWRGSYMMNLTDSSGTAQIDGASGQETYRDYAYRMSKAGAQQWFNYIGGQQDGFMLDFLGDSMSWIMWSDIVRSIDLNHDNVADEFADLDAAFTKGVDSLSARFRADFPGKPQVRNNSRSKRYSAFNGENFESFPQDAWETEIIDGNDGRTYYWHGYVFGASDQERGPMVEFTSKAAEPSYTIVCTADIETDLNSSGIPELQSTDKRLLYKPDFKKMRMGLTTALLTGAYFSFVLSTDGNGELGLFWFDEFDDAGAGRGYLGRPQGEIVKLATDTRNKKWGVWGRAYSGGYVIVNPLGKPMKIDLPAGRWQRINGQQDPKVNSGAVEEGSITMPAYDGLILKKI